MCCRHSIWNQKYHVITFFLFCFVFDSLVWASPEGEQHLAPESDPGVQVLHHHPRNEGLFVAGVNAGQVGRVLPAGFQSRVPRGWLLHQLVAVGVPGGVALWAGVRRRRRGLDAGR